MYNKGDVLTVEITDMGINGEGIGKVEGYTLFVKDAVAGDKVRVSIMKAKKELDAKKSAYGSTMTDKQYQDKLSELKKGIVDGQKIPTLTVIIRPLDTATYENMISALDEMLICSIDKYVIDKIGPEDKALIEKAGVK